ncbi:MAG: tetraacyldisaccharide 4'-kinase [Pseudomonadota bacterium]
MRRAPAFWSAKPGWQSTLLAPLAALYAAGTARRVAQPSKFVADVPVICVGNLSAGGTGKTPVVIALAEMLRDAGKQVAVVTRGYGGSLDGPARVDPEKHSADEAGDEPLLLTGFAQVWVSKDRAEGARAAVENGADVILLDDGFQNPDVAKDLSLVVVDAGVGFGNGKVIPAGPLREPVKVGIKRADALVLIGSPGQREAFEAPPGVPVLGAELLPLQTGLLLEGLPVLAFAGIGRPEKFFETLRRQGADIRRTVPLGDHQPLTTGLMTRLDGEAKARGLQLVTTEKDAVRLPPSFRQQVMTIPVRLVFQDPTAIAELLAPLIEL